MIPPDALAKTLLLPLMAAQGGWARLRAGGLPEAAGPRAGVAGDGVALNLLVLGDSAAAGVGAAHQDDALIGHLVAGLARDHRVAWQLVARTGATTGSTLARVQAMPPEAFDPGNFNMVLVVLGVNDVTTGLNLRRLLARRAALYALLRTRFAAPHILVTGLPPLRDFPALPQPLRWVLGRQAQRYEAALRAQVAEMAQGMARAPAGAPGIAYAPFTLPFQPDMMAPDGFHPGPEAYALWAETLALPIRAALSRATA